MTDDRIRLVSLLSFHSFAASPQVASAPPISDTDAAMPHPERPSAHPLPSASSSSVLHLPHQTKASLFPLFAELTFHIVPAKLDGELGKVYAWVEELGGRCVAVEEATFVITALRGRARIERAIGKRFVCGTGRG